MFILYLVIGIAIIASIVIALRNNKKEKSNPHTLFAEPFEKRYEILIERIKDLAAHYNEEDFYDYDDYQKRYSKIEIKQAQNFFQISFSSSTKGSLSLSKDTFELSEKSNNLLVNWCRESIKILPMFPLILPREVTIYRKFKHSDDQEYILKKMIEDINSKFHEYNFRDSIYYMTQTYRERSNDIEDLNNNFEYLDTEISVEITAEELNMRIK